ncbi:MAG: tripartite tricarboxylate transporter substrate binding protein [Betaproteobacteria bacterium]|nr:tripartite tricarboxylate transporter substrate binding protein [Betaproteobacteria bacterium]
MKSNSAICSLRVVLTALAALGSTGNVPAQTSSTGAAQDYPIKPIRLVSPFTAGGSSDTLGRLIGIKLAETWNQQIVVENRPGAGGVIGTDFVAKAAPDGYTILLTSSSTVAVAPALGVKLPYDSLTDLAPITQVASAHQILVVHPSLPVKSVRELIAFSKSRPGELAFATNGNGTPSHIAGELFEQMAKVDMLAVPYKGGSQGSIAVVSGEVSLTFGSLISMLPYVRGGRLRALAVTGAKRSIALPSLPTVSEAGLRGYEVNNWYGMFAPAATPQNIIAKLNAAIVRVMHLPEVRERLLNLGVEPVGNLPRELAAYMKTEIAKWTQLIKSSGARKN